MAMQPKALDVVITWVDGTDPGWQDDLLRYQPRQATPEHVADGPRFRDSGLLRFVLRSVEQNFQDAGRIWLVTSGQIPEWLDAGHRDICVVRHADIFSNPGHLPTFNSMAIECHLHRIPQLGDQFIYLNDDVFFLRKTTSSRFLTPDGGHEVPLEEGPMPSSLLRGETADRSLAYTGLVLGRRFASLSPGLLVAHGPQVYDRRWMNWIWGQWQAELERTSRSRFRQTDCIAWRYLYYYSLLHLAANERPEFARSSSYPMRILSAKEQQLLMLANSAENISSHLESIDGSPPAFLCINDDEPDPAAAKRKLEPVHCWLERRFPVPSKWERQATGFNALSLAVRGQDSRRTNTEMAGETKFAAVGDFEVSQVPDGFVIYDEANEQVHYLNPSAAVIYTLCDGKRTANEIVSFVADAYDLADDELEFDSIFDDLEKAGLVCRT
jgi:hypothetical protein